MTRAARALEIAYDSGKQIKHDMVLFSVIKKYTYNGLKLHENAFYTNAVMIDKTMYHSTRRIIFSCRMNRKWSVQLIVVRRI